MVVIITRRQRGTEGTLGLQRKLSEGHCKSFIFLAFLKGISFILKCVLVLDFCLHSPVFAVYNTNLPLPSGITTAQYGFKISFH